MYIMGPKKFGVQLFESNTRMWIRPFFKGKIHIHILNTLQIYLNFRVPELSNFFWEDSDPFFAFFKGERSLVL